MASPELFDAYFRFVVPETTVSNVEMDAHMSHLDDRAAFAALLLRLASERDSSGAPRVTAFLERLRAAVPTLDAERAANAVGGLLAAGDDLPDRQAAVALAVALLRQIPPAARRELDLPRWRLGRVGDRGRGHGRAGPGAWRAMGRTRSSRRMRGSSRRSSSSSSSRPSSAASASTRSRAGWRCRPTCPLCSRRGGPGTPTAARSWVASAIQRDDTLARIVSAFVVRVRSDGGPARGPHGSLRLDPEALRPYIAPGGDRRPDPAAGARQHARERGHRRARPVRAGI